MSLMLAILDAMFCLDISELIDVLRTLWRFVRYRSNVDFALACLFVSLIYYWMLASLNITGCSLHSTYTFKNSCYLALIVLILLAGYPLRGIHHQCL